MFNVFGYLANHYLAGGSKRVVIVSCFALIFCIGFLDYWIGADIGLSIFYLIPISLATWYVGMRGGLIAACFSALTWLGAKWMTDDTFIMGTSLWNTGIRLTFFIVIVFQQNALKSEQRRARRDPLTRIGNRRYFRESATNELDRAKRYNRLFTVVYMDLDNFKKVNDTHGHNAGDMLLRVVTTVLKKNVRSTDIIARLGGDEFALLLPETGADAAKRVVQKMHEQLLAAMQNKHWPVTFSIGVVTFVDQPESLEAMIKAADDLMYSVKNSGKNQVKYYTFGVEQNIDQDGRSSEDRK